MSNESTLIPAYQKLCTVISQERPAPELAVAVQHVLAAFTTGDPLFRATRLTLLSAASGDPINLALFEQLEDLHRQGSGQSVTVTAQVLGLLAVIEASVSTAQADATQTSGLQEVLELYLAGWSKTLPQVVDWLPGEERILAQPLLAHLPGVRAAFTG